MPLTNTQRPTREVVHLLYQYIDGATKISLPSLSDAFRISQRFCRLSLLLNRDRFSQIPWEVHVKTLSDSKPVSDQLERNDIQKTLQDVNRLGYFNSLRL